MSKRTEWDAFAEALAAKPERRPEGAGWKERSELADALRLTDSRVSERLNAAVRLGKLERFEGLSVRDGRLSRTVWYRPKKR